LKDIVKVDETFPLKTEELLEFKLVLALQIIEWLVHCIIIVVQSIIFAVRTDITRVLLTCTQSLSYGRRVPAMHFDIIFLDTSFKVLETLQAGLSFLLS